jgi:hypothetical protein
MAFAHHLANKPALQQLGPNNSRALLSLPAQMTIRAIARAAKASKRIKPTFWRWPTMRASVRSPRLTGSRS